MVPKEPEKRFKRRTRVRAITTGRKRTKESSKNIQKTTTRIILKVISNFVTFLSQT